MRARLQLGNLEVTIWERCRRYGAGRPETLDFTFTIEQLGTSTIEDAREYEEDHIETVIRLTRWADAQIHHFNEELP